LSLKVDFVADDSWNLFHLVVDRHGFVGHAALYAIFAGFCL